MLLFLIKRDTDVLIFVTVICLLMDVKALLL